MAGYRRNARPDDEPVKDSPRATYFFIGWVIGGLFGALMGFLLHRQLHAHPAPPACHDTVEWLGQQPEHHCTSDQVGTIENGQFLMCRCK